MNEEALATEGVTITKDHQTSHNQERESGLTVRQMNAVELLAVGKKVNEVAEIVGVSRRQVWVWSQNPFFIAELSRQRGELWRGSKVRLRGLVEQAVDVLEQAIQSGDVKAALEVLKIVGLHAKVGPPPAPKTVDQVLEEQATEFIDELIGNLPTSNPRSDLEYRMNVRPQLIREYYQELKDNLAVPADQEEMSSNDDVQNGDANDF